MVNRRLSAKATLVELMLAKDLAGIAVQRKSYIAEHGYNEYKRLYKQANLQVNTEVYEFVEFSAKEISDSADE